MVRKTLYSFFVYWGCYLQISIFYTCSEGKALARNSIKSVEARQSVIVANHDTHIMSDDSGVLLQDGTEDGGGDSLEDILNPDMSKYRRGGRRTCIISDLISQTVGSCKSEYSERLRLCRVLSAFVEPFKIFYTKKFKPVIMFTNILMLDTVSDFT